MKKLCPNCKLRERHVLKTGHVLGYCKECWKLKKKPYKCVVCGKWCSGKRCEKCFSRKKRRLSTKSGVCPKCKKNKRVVTKSGYVYTYCRECNTKRQEEMRRKRGIKKRKIIVNPTKIDLYNREYQRKNRLVIEERADKTRGFNFMKKLEEKGFSPATANALVVDGPVLDRRLEELMKKKVKKSK